MSLRVLIVDDEPLARERLQQLLAELDDIVVAGEAGDGTAAIERCACGEVDLVLLDIRMPGIDGIETARHLATLAQPPAIVFLTAYDDRAIDAFEAGAVDYLLKPVRRERLQQALARACRLRPADLAATGIAGGPRQHFLERRAGGVRLVGVADVLCLRAEDKYVRLQTAASEHLIEDSLVTIEREFGGRFLRIHRNCLVAADRVQALERSHGQDVVRIDGLDQPLEVSRRNLAAVREHLLRRA